MSVERLRFLAQSQSGFSIMGVVIAAGVAGAISMFLMDQIVNANRAQSSLERRLEVSGIKQRLMVEVDCPNTLAGVNFATQCDPATPFYLRLKNKANNNIDGAAGTGVLANSRQLEGQWFSRTTCDTVTGTPTLRVQIALQGPTAGTFGKDPQTRQDYDWANVRGSIFSPTGTTLCSAELGGGGGGGGGPWKSGDLADSGASCQSNMMSDDDGNDSYNRNLYTGTVLCDPGKSAISGSVDCGAGGAVRLQHSHVTPGGNGWTGACCPDGAFAGAGRIKVLCQ